MKHLCFFLLAVMLISSCTVPCVNYNMPYIDFVLVDQQDSSILSQKNQIADLHYLKDNQRQRVNLFVGKGTSYGYLASSSELVILSTRGHKTYFLETAGDIDTVYVDAVKRFNGGCSETIIKKVLFNGKEPENIKTPEGSYYKFVRRSPAVSGK